MYEEGGSDVLPSLVKYNFLIIHPVQIYCKQMLWFVTILQPNFNVWHRSVLRPKSYEAKARGEDPLTAAAVWTEKLQQKKWQSSEQIEATYILKMLQQTKIRFSKEKKIVFCFLILKTFLSHFSLIHQKWKTKLMAWLARSFFKLIRAWLFRGMETVSQSRKCYRQITKSVVALIFSRHAHH